MRPELNTIEIIEKYLLNQLNEADRKSVEAKIHSDVRFREKVEAQRKIMQAVNDNALKKIIKQQYKAKMLKNKFFKGGLTFAIVSLATVLAVFTYSKSGSENNIKHELNEKGEKIWATADKLITPEFFELDNSKDTVIETKGGMILAIPAGSFGKANGEEVKKVELEVKEALDAATILSSGLSTMSGDKPLETGGMFYFNARENGENLKINKAIQANVPTGNKKAGMLLFKGERRADGTIDWVDPKPLENNLTTVDIATLNFYPPNYEDSLEGWGYDRSNKIFKDSLYYSFSPTTLDPGMPKDTTINYTEASDSIPILSGELLFKQNCAACHAMDKKLVGPALAGIVQRTPSRDWLGKFIQSPATMIKLGDRYAAKVLAENNGVNGMSEFGFIRGKNLENLIDYLEGIPSEAALIKSYTGLNPAKVRVIWSEKYNNTILATKEFEERIKVIHKTYNENILMLYVNNLDKPLYKIDSMAAMMSSRKEKIKFSEFYKRNEAGVPATSDLQEKLNQYFSEKQKIFTEAAAKARKAALENYNKLISEMGKNNLDHLQKIQQQQADNLNRELNINLDEAYRQLGKKRPNAIPPSPGYYSATISSPGWNNVDKYVLESTTTRTTLDYTDKETGRKAVIKYNPVSISINEFEKYDNVFAYLLADNLNNFMFMKKNENTFKESLNELFKYDLVVVGLKGDEKYIYTEKDIARDVEKRVGLRKTDETEFRQIVMSLNRNTSAQEKMQQEFQHLLTQQKNILLKKKFEKNEELRERIIPVIFKVEYSLTPMK